MAKKEEKGLDFDDVVKSAKKFVKAGKLDDLAEAWVENKENADNPNALVNLLGQVGEFIKENDIEDKLEDLLTEDKTTKKKSTTTKKKTSTSKKTTSTKKSTTSKKTDAKKSSSSTKKKNTEKKTSSAKKTTKKSTSAKKTTSTAKKTASKKTTKKSS